MINFGVLKYDYCALYAYYNSDDSKTYMVFEYSSNVMIIELGKTMRFKYNVGKEIIIKIGWI